MTDDKTRTEYITLHDNGDITIQVGSTDADAPTIILREKICRIIADSVNERERKKKGGK